MVRRRRMLAASGIVGDGSMIAWPDPTDHRDCHPGGVESVGVLSGSYPIPDPAPGAEDAFMDDETTPEINPDDEINPDQISGPDPTPGPAGGASGVEAPPPRARPTRLRRDMEHRMLGGVAAGLALYLDVDVVIIRVAIAALTLLGGAGALIYVAAWLLVPADNEEQPLAQQWVGRRPEHRSLVVIILGAVIGIVALSDLWWNGPWWPRPGGGIGLGLGAVAVVLALTLVLNSGGNRTVGSRLRWLLLTMVLASVAVVVVAAATVFSIEAASGVPLRGGIGDTQWQPTSASQLAPNYRLAIGNLTVDLSDMTFRTGTTHVTASVGFGRLLVEVPPGPTVSVVAHSGLGDVEVFGQNNSGLSTIQTAQSLGQSGGQSAGQSGGARTASRPHLVIDADAGVGRVQVVRMQSAFS
jgi:phage shock protein PspC (stress-responsive transcriptional regulator)